MASLPAIGLGLMLGGGLGSAAGAMARKRKKPGTPGAAPAPSADALNEKPADALVEDPSSLGEGRNVDVVESAVKEMKRRRKGSAQTANPYRPSLARAMFGGY